MKRNRMCMTAAFLALFSGVTTLLAAAPLAREAARNGCDNTGCGGGSECVYLANYSCTLDSNGTCITHLCRAD